MFQYFLNRLREPSSILGILVFGSHIAQAIATKDPVAVANAVGGLIAVVVPEAAAQDKKA